MATTEQYLTQLKQDLDTLKEAYIERGVEVSENDTFTNLAQKSGDLPTGGGSGTDWLSMITNAEKLFDTNSSIVELGDVNLPKATIATNLFRSCSNLKKVGNVSCPNLGISSNGYIFYGCSSLEEVKGLYLGPTTKGYGSTFYGCKKMKTFPDIIINQDADVQYFFYQCQSMTEIPKNIDFSKAISCGNMFNGCNNLVNVNGVDLSSATGCNYLFKGCTKLVTCTNLKIGPCSAMGYMFDGDYLLEEVSIIMPKRQEQPLSTARMFNGCSKLKEVDIRDLDLTYVTSVSLMFNNVPKNCHIIVNQASYDAQTSLFNDYTNVEIQPARWEAD